MALHKFTLITINNGTLSEKNSQYLKLVLTLIMYSRVFQDLRWQNLSYFIVFFICLSYGLFVFNWDFRDEMLDECIQSVLILNFWTDIDHLLGFSEDCPLFVLFFWTDLCWRRLYIKFISRVTHACSIELSWSRRTINSPLCGHMLLRYDFLLDWLSTWFFKRTVHFFLCAPFFEWFWQMFSIFKLKNA